MSSDGEIVLKLLGQVRQVCEQVGFLLQTADAQMLKAGFKSEGNTAIDGISYAIINPRQWIPTTAFRFYKHKDYPKRLAFISVLLDNREDIQYTINEPLVTAGFLDFGEVDASLQNESGYSDYWYSRYFGYLMKDHLAKPDGKPFSFENAQLDNEIKGRFKIGTVFAIPLVSVASAEGVKSEVVTKLTSLFKNTENNSP